MIGRIIDIWAFFVITFCIVGFTGGIILFLISLFGGKK